MNKLINSDAGEAGALRHAARYLCRCMLLCQQIAILARWRGVMFRRRETWPAPAIIGMAGLLAMTILMPRVHL